MCLSTRANSTDGLSRWQQHYLARRKRPGGLFVYVSQQGWPLPGVHVSAHGTKKMCTGSDSLRGHGVRMPLCHVCLSCGVVLQSADGVVCWDSLRRRRSLSSSQPSPGCMCLCVYGFSMHGMLVLGQGSATQVANLAAFCCTDDRCHVRQARQSNPGPPLAPGDHRGHVCSSTFEANVMVFRQGRVSAGVQHPVVCFSAHH